MLEEFSLGGQVALVTGGGRGIGRGIAVGLARAGATVAVSSRSSDQLADAVERIRAAGGEGHAIPADLEADGTAEGLVEEVLDRTGRLDVLVHAAGNQIRKPALEFTAAEYDAIQYVHVRAAFLLACSLGRHLAERGNPGSIMFVGSMTSFRGLSGIAPYGTAKTALLGLARALAVEWAPIGIRVNVIAPGFFLTEMTRPIQDAPGRQELQNRTPMGRQGDPDLDMAGTAIYLASPASRYVTGQVISVDGGWSVA
jgi:NAD(P)-dependent dehydrogenase (short-subunit alcohol dehydrogenase family)